MRSWIAIGLALCLGGCAAFRSYDKSLEATVELASSGNIDGAIKQLNTANPGEKKDSLYFLELGTLQRLDKRYAESQKSWTEASERLLPIEVTGAKTAANLAGGIASYVVNDRLRPYPGYDYEKVMLLTNIALNQLAMSDFDRARVAVRQTHELEAIIADERDKQFSKVEEDAKKHGAKSSFKELNGYPIATIDNAEVNALKNSYQSALSHYLAGFVYEALGESSLAAPGYRLANELQPGQPLLEEALAGLDQRIAARPDGMVDVLFVIGAGTAPAMQSKQFNLPVPTAMGGVTIAVSFPVMTASQFSPLPTRISLEDGRVLPIAPIASVDLMARRRLKDDMPAIMLRSTIRAASRAALQAGLQNQARNSNDQAGAGAMVSLIASLFVSVGTTVTEQADERTWRTLPSQILISRGRVPAGVHTVTLQTPVGDRTARVELSGRYAVVDLRLIRGRLFVNAPQENSPSTGATPAALEQVSQPKEASK